MKRVALALALGTGVAAGVGACVTDHDALAKRPPHGGAAGQAGQGGADASAGSGGSGGSGGSAGSVLDASDTDAYVEPTGKSELTLLHGVVDAQHIAFCFAKSSASGIEWVGNPIPSNGLAYGAAIALGSVAGIDLAADDVELYVVAAEPTLLAGQSCAALTAQPPLDPDGGDPAIRAAALALVPKGTFAGGYSVLLVAAGCLGGAPSHSDGIDDLLCGNGYSPQSPTLMPLVTQLSRATNPSRVGLQVVNASAAGEEIDVRSLPPEASSLTPAYVAFGIPVGGIAPRPPNLVYSAAALGSPLAQAKIEVASSQNSSLSIGFFWGDALALAAAGTIEDGHTYALVLLGPRLTITNAGSWWSAPAVTVIPTDPDT